MPLRRRVLIPLLLLPALGLGACGGGRREADVSAPPLGAATTPGTTATAPTATQTTPATTSTQPATTPATTTPGATQTTPSSPQGTGGAPAGCDRAIGGFIRNLQASGTDCARARDVANAWFAAVHGGAAPDAQIAAAGYTCSGALAGERASVTCTAASGASKVAFTASP